MRSEQAWGVAPCRDGLGLVVIVVVLRTRVLRCVEEERDELGAVVVGEAAAVHDSGTRAQHVCCCISLELRVERTGWVLDRVVECDEVWEDVVDSC